VAGGNDFGGLFPQRDRCGLIEASELRATPSASVCFRSVIAAASLKLERLPHRRADEHRVSAA